MANAEKRERRLQSRIIGLGRGRVCGRCGGSGHYSFNLMTGTRCFGCGGSGFVPQRLTEVLFMELSADVTAGKLETYLAGLARKSELKRRAEGAMDRVMAAWKATGISALYDWRKASGPNADTMHRQIADLNAPMAAHHERVMNLAFAVDSEGNRKVTSAAERAARDAKVEAMTAELVKLTDAALAEIPELGRKAIEVANRYALNPS